MSWKSKKTHYFDPRVHELVSLWMGDYAKEHELTQEQLALKLDAPLSTINRLLNMRIEKQISVYRLFKWVESLDFEVQIKIVPKKVANDNKLAAQNSLTDEWVAIRLLKVTCHHGGCRWTSPFLRTTTRP